MSTAYVVVVIEVKHEDSWAALTMAEQRGHALSTLIPGVVGVQVGLDLTAAIERVQR